MLVRLAWVVCRLPRVRLGPEGPQGVCGMDAAPSNRARVYVLFAIVVLACALGSLTQTVMNPMLEQVEADFGISASVGQWLTTLYMLVIGITVPVVTFLSLRLSLRSLVFLTLGLFAIGALIDLLAPTFALLLLGRVFQAASAGITLPLLQSIAMLRFPPGQNATAMGIAGIAMGFAPNIGPLIGGALVDSFGWRSFFVLLLVVLVVLFVASAIAIEKEAAPSRAARLDVASFALSTFGFGGLLLAFSNASNMSVASPLVWGFLIVGVVCLVLFVIRQRRVEHPLIHMGIFSARSFRVSFVIQNCLFASFMGITLIVPVYVQGLCGGTALEAGLVFIPATVLALFVNPFAGVLSDKLGARPVVICAATFLTIGAVAMAFVDESTPLWLLTCMQTVRAIGVSALIGPLNSWGMSQLPHDIMMDGSAFFACVRQACASFGTAIMMLAITACGGLAAAPALGYQVAFGISALFSTAVLVGAIFKLR